MMELLCPAGSLLGAKTAVDYGADAIYMAGESFGMRTAAAFKNDDIINALEYAHNKNVAVHITCNTLSHNDDIAKLPEYLTFLNDLKPDALIVADMGTIMLCKKYAPDIPLHISVQSGIVNYETARAYYELGAQRVVLARELTLDEIAEIRAKTPNELELEAFAHGALCISYSARCLLSDYLTGRDANRGACAQSCRWKYALVEESRPGEYLPIAQDDTGSYILNSYDLCMAEHLTDMQNAGVDSIKIEGRAKSEYYVAVVTNAYRHALDLIKDDKPFENWIMDELNTISHRPYGQGFYYGKPKNQQNYETAGYIRDYAVAAIVDDYKDGYIIATIKNKFLCGTVLYCLQPFSKPIEINTDLMFYIENNKIDMANKPMTQIKIPFDTPVNKSAFLRMKVQA